MSNRASQAELAERVTKVWDRPRLRVDTATLLEIYPNAFSFRVLGIIFGALTCAIGFFAGQSEIGRAAWAAKVTIPAFGIGGAALVFSILGLVKLVSGKGQYKSAQTFADMMFVHVLGQPGAPNYHLYERVALPETLGVAADREDDNDEVADCADSLHAWMERSRVAISEALLERAGVEADATLFENAPMKADEMIVTKIQTTLGVTRADGETAVSIDGAEATVATFARSATFQFRAPETVLGHLTPDGHKLAEASVQTVLHISVVRTPVDSWYVVDAGLDAIKPGAAEDATEMV